MTEEWLSVVGYEGLYEVSNLGNVRKTDGKMIKQFVEPVRGYMKVSLRKDKKNKSIFVHRLVAMAFIPNPNDYPIVNHKDENKTNNCVNNLEWCTYQYNMTYGTIRERLSKKTVNSWKNGKMNRDKQRRESDAKRYARNREIQERYAKGDISQRKLAKMYGIDQKEVCYIIHHGKTDFEDNKQISEERKIMKLLVEIDEELYRKIIAHRALTKYQKHLDYEALKNMVEDGQPISDIQKYISGKE